MVSRVTQCRAKYVFDVEMILIDRGALATPSKPPQRERETKLEKSDESEDQSIWSRQ